MNNSKIYIEQWEIISSTTLLLSDGQEAKISLTPEDPLDVRIRFVSTPLVEGEVRKSGLTAIGEGSVGVITFTNWSSSLGSVTKEPLHFANDEKGRVISLMASVWRIATSYQVVLQFMRREVV